VSVLTIPGNPEKAVEAAIANIANRRRHLQEQLRTLDKEAIALRKKVLRALNGVHLSTKTRRKMSDKQKAILVAATKKRWAKWRKERAK
jgi:predicted RNase H-like nuclease (RuvC/YqgF family)